jgi:hypothetical protein
MVEEKDVNYKKPELILINITLIYIYKYRFARIRFAGILERDRFYSYDFSLFNNKFFKIYKILIFLYKYVVFNL